MAPPLRLVCLAHLVDNLPKSFGMSLYRPVYASTICWINNRYGMALFFSVPIGALILENVIFFVVAAINICKSGRLQRRFHPFMRQMSLKTPPYHRRPPRRSQRR